jgi:hypothetical protein
LRALWRRIDRWTGQAAKERPKVRPIAIAVGVEIAGSGQCVTGKRGAEDYQRNTPRTWELQVLVFLS